jgi:hypothetical protein
MSSGSRASSGSRVMSRDKLHIILDIDETLLYFIHHRVRAHSWDTLTDDEKSKYTFIEDKHRNIILPRPHLQRFLTYLFKHFNVSLWTLSEREYAESIRDLLITKGYPTRNIHYIFSADDDEEHEVSAKEIHGNNKDLNWLWYQYASKYPGFYECNTILIDDLPANALNPSNRQNAIHITPYALFGEVKKRTDPYKDVSKDDVLLIIIQLLKKMMRHSNPSCYSGDNRWSFLFSAENCETYKLMPYRQTVRYKNKEIQALHIKPSLSS